MRGTAALFFDLALFRLKLQKVVEFVPLAFLRPCRVIWHDLEFVYDSTTNIEVHFPTYVHTDDGPFDPASHNPYWRW